MEIWFKGQLFDTDKTCVRILDEKSLDEIKKSYNEIIKSYENVSKNPVINEMVYQLISKNDDQKFLLLSINDTYGIVLTKNRAHEIGHSKKIDLNYCTNDCWWSTKDTKVWKRINNVEEAQIINEIRNG